MGNILFLIDCSENDEDPMTNLNQKDITKLIKKNVKLEEKYEGSYDENGKKSGNGKMILKDGSSYEGNFDNDKFHGFGKYTCASGVTYEGNWVNGLRSGKGKYVSKNGSSYEGIIYIHLIYYW